MTRSTIPLESIADALDRHPLTTAERVAIFAALDAPGGHPEWVAAREIRLAPPASLTLWDAVVQQNGSWYAAEYVTPGTYTILQALETA